MGVIHRLPSDLANQIAAGEVVERPSSVVKELVENSIDAGASRIRVEIEGGGVGLVRVSDDGAGMIADDAVLALERHATSKIRALDDLRRIGTHGFRGEALPSIASVARLTLRTRRREDAEGVEVTVEGGGPARVAPSGGAVGTTVDVRDLFFNVPARRKFLRALPTEAAHVTEVAQAAALSRPDLTLTLTREGRVVREWLRAAGREERVLAALGSEPLATCRGERGPLVVEAFLGRPEKARASTGGLSLFVNGRHVRDRSLLRAVAQAYGSVLEPGRYPFGVVYLDLHPELVDVNVHPQKAEVRFADGRAVGEALFRILADELSRAFGMPVARRGGSSGARPASPLASSGLRPGPEPRGSDEVEPWTFVAASPTLYPVGAGSPGGQPAAVAEHASDPGASARAAEPSEAARGAFASLRFVAQVRQTYLVCEGADGLYVLDQHASAERVTFHRLRGAYAGRTLAMQTLLFPATVEVGASDVAFVEEQQAAFTSLGFDVRAAGPTTVAVYALPRLLERARPEEVLRDVIAEVSRTGGRAFSNAVDLVLATMACHGSVRAGDPLSAEAAWALLASLDGVDFSGHCPHGRPILTRIGWEELERKVGRR